MAKIQKPLGRVMVDPPTGVREWDAFFEALAGEANGIATMKTYAVSNLPPALPAGRVIYVADAAGGATLAFSNGTNWLRVWDMAVVT